MNLFKIKNDQKFISQVVVLSIIFGFAAGVVGQIVSNVYFDPWQNNYIYQDTLASNANPLNNVEQIPELRRIERFLGIQQDFEVNNSIQKAKPTMVGIYFKKSQATKPIDQLYLSSGLKANGFILTNDGWVITYGDVFKNAKNEDFVVAYGEKIFSVENIVIDSVTGVVFVKISATNLPVVILGDSKDMTNGQLGIALNFLDEVSVTSIKSVNYWPVYSKDDYILSSEAYNKLFLLADNLDGNYVGGPLINLGGELIGIIKEFDSKKGVSTVLPINQFRSIILDVLKDNKITRPYLGIKYIDLSQSVGLSNELSQNLNKGALVYQKPDLNSPAAEIGIEQYDIIVSVYGQQVSEENNLAELLQQYKAGDKIELEILRGKETMVKSLALSALSD